MTQDDAARPGLVDTLVGALNGVLGDYLRQRENGLETPLAFMHGNRPLALEPAGIAGAHPAATGKVCVLLHGSGCTEGVFGFAGAPGTTYGSLLAADLGFSPFYLRYNSGLHVSENGEAFAAAMERLLDAYPVPVEEVVLIGYSMGGLVARSACHFAASLEQRWLARVTRAIYIATPHLGAPLEKAGNVVTWLLRNVPNPYTRLIADVANLRSSGIKDLRYSNLVRQDWEGLDPDALLQNRRHPVPLLPGIAHYLVAGTMTRREDHMLALLFGDAVVRVASAAGRAGPADRSPVFPQEHVRIVPGVAHLGLARHPDVYAHIQKWCAEERT